MKLLSVTLLIGTAACGQQNELGKTESEKMAPTGAMLVANTKALPKCIDKLEGQIAYVKEDDQFVSCNNLNWDEIVLKGKDGKDGLDGSNGSDGVAGKDGVDGRDGVDGANGAAGRNGRDGIDAKDINVKLTDADGIDIGIVYSVDGAGYHVGKNNLRYDISQSGGTFLTLRTFYSGADCTGEMKVVKYANQWANVGIEANTGKVIKMVGRPSNGFAFNSIYHVPDRFDSSTCINQVGSVDKAYDAEEFELEFAYPVVGAEMTN